MEYYTTKQIYPWLYAIYDPGDVYIYLVLGDDAALVFDTGYGIAPIMPVVRKITDLPVICVLGHGHIDHANGAYQFKEAWIYEEDLELCLRHTGKKAKARALDRLSEKNVKLPEDFDEEMYITSGAGSLKTMDIGQIFQLGGKSLEVVKMEGHTHGSAGLLVRQERVLLTSDGANSFMWLFLEESTHRSAYIAMLERNINLEFDTFFIAHDDRPFAKDCFKKFINVAKNANMAQAKPFERLPERRGMVYKEGDVAIIFSEDKL
jgi:glyoxylase-like metal-dependent hydrolase (beta-lactamase superfamily II)